MTNNNGATSYSYDNMNNLLTVNRDDSVVEYTYDLLGNNTKITYPSGKVVDYSYDLNNNIIEVKDGLDITSYTYENNRVKTTTLPNGIVETNTYDLLGRITDKTSVLDTVTITSYQYTYDQFSNVLTETRFEDNKTTNITNTYNERDELVESVQDTEGSVTTYTYSYDLFGNKSEKVVTDTGTDSRYYTYNHLNRLTNISGDRSASIIYDNNGNIRVED